MSTRDRAESLHRRRSRQVAAGLKRSRVRTSGDAKERAVALWEDSNKEEPT